MIKVWSLDEMSHIETVYGHTDTVQSLDAMYKERAVSVGGRDNTVRLWKIVEESQLVFNGPGFVQITESIYDIRKVTISAFCSKVSSPKSRGCNL